MKFRLFGISLLLAGSSLLIIGCPSNNSPSSPSSPAPTNTPVFTSTPCQNASGTPCTSTPTPTNSPTGTPTNTATSTDSQTATGTPTNTRTSTATFTITNTATITSTATITNTPTNTATATITDTPPPFTFTFTPTATNTVFVCYTPAPTSTPTSTGYSVSGTLNTSYWTATSANPLGILYYPTGGGTKSSYAFVNSNGGSYSIQGMASGNYYAVYWWNGVGDGGKLSYPHVGDFADIYGATSCTFSSGTQVSVTGAITGEDFSVDENNIVWGVAGTISYTGALGTVNSCSSLNVVLFQAGTLTAHSCNVTGTVWGDAQPVYSNGGRYDALAYLSGGNLCGSSTVDVLAWYSSLSATTYCGAGNGNAPSKGDPYVILSGVSTGNSYPVTNFSFDDTNIW